MSAYVILDVDVTDPKGYEGYKELATPTVSLYGGKYVARGGRNETLEGEWHSKRIVILEFENMDRAKAWVNSPEYAPARALRNRSTNSKMIVVEGI